MIIWPSADKKFLSKEACRYTTVLYLCRMESCMRMPRIACNADNFCNTTARTFKRTWQWGGFSGVFAEIGSSWVPFELFLFWLRIRRDIRNRKTTPRITDTESRLLNFFKENSLHRWYGESSTPHTSDTVSCRLPVSPIWRVDHSAYHWVGESIGDTGSRNSKKN